MSDQQQLTVLDFDVSATALERYGTRAEVRELTTRLMSFHPEAAALGEKTMTAAAQLAVMLGVNPLAPAGEMYIYFHKGRPTIEIGIAYYRRRAGEVDKLIWLTALDPVTRVTRTYEPRMMLESDRQEHGIPAGIIAGICKGYRLSTYQALLDTGMPWEQAVHAATHTGIGVVDPADLFAKDGKPIKAPNGRTWQWVANKRAEKDLLRALNLVNFEATPPPPAATPQPAAAAPARQALTIEQINEDLFG